MDRSPAIIREAKPVRQIPWGTLLFLLVPLGGVAAVAAGRLEKTFDTTPTPAISLTNLKGQVVVRGWDKPQVHAVCTTVSPRVEVDNEAIPRTGLADRVQFTIHLLDPSVTGGEETADCTLEVPLGASLEIRNRQGSVQIDRLEGHASIHSAGGRIAAADVSGHLMARTLGGDIEIVRSSGRVDAFSITGSVRIVAPTSKRLRANTNSGRITYQGDFEPGGDYIMSTYSGDIDIVCAASASFELDAKTVNGKLDNTVSLTPKRHPVTPLFSGSSLLGTRNRGNASVELTSFSGTIRVRQQP